MPVSYIPLKQDDFQDASLSVPNMVLRQQTDELNRLGGLNGTVSIVSSMVVNGSVSAKSIVLGAATILTGSGYPEGKVSAAVGSLYLNLSGGINKTLWVKETGSGPFGWAAK
jgi:hypothetical protein